MQRAKNMLDEVKEGIINAYEMKTGLPRDEISQMMDAETWLSAKKAVELGFADKVMFEGEKEPENSVALTFSRTAVMNSLISRCKPSPERDTRIILPTPVKLEEKPKLQNETEIHPTPKDVEEPPTAESETPPDDRVDTSTLMHRLNLISH